MRKIRWGEERRPIPRTFSQIDGAGVSRKKRRGRNEIGITVRKSCPARKKYREGFPEVEKGRGLIIVAKNTRIFK